VSHAPARCRSLPDHLARCPRRQGASSWQDRQGPSARRYRGERARTPRAPRHLGHYQRGQGWLVELVALTGCLGPLRGRARDLEMPTRGSWRPSGRRCPGSPGRAPVALTTCGTCLPKWPSRTQPSSGNPGAHHCRPAGPSRGQTQFQRVVDALVTKLPEASEHLEEVRCDLLAFRHFRKRTLAPDLEHQPARSASTRRSADGRIW